MWAKATVVCWLSIALLSPGTAAASGAQELIWIEAEDADQKQVFHNPWFETVDEDTLSGGKWLASFSEPHMDTGTALYRVQVPQSGSYHFWLRGNPRGTGLSYRIDGGEWQPVPIDEMKREIREHRRGEDFQPRLVQEISVAAGWDARFLAWFDLGTVHLSEGTHTFEFLLGNKEEEKRFSSIDCFVLARGQFSPHYKFKPGESWENVIQYPESETWAWEPERDTFSRQAAFDLRSLNEEVAGEHGFIRRNEDGLHFVRGDGQPIRFWGGSTYVQRNAWRSVDRALQRAKRARERGDTARAESHEREAEGARQQAWQDLRHHARFLAKRGVNMVRWHGDLPPKEKDSEITDVDEDALQQAWRMVAAMKEEGIYSTLSPCWMSHTSVQPGWDIPDSGTGRLTAMVFWEPAVQEGYKAWLKALFDRVNPYTGTRLADDPAVAIIQLQNEDSMLFYTMQRVKGEARRHLRQRYADWLEEKYGSLEKARAAWGGNEHENDDFANGEAGLNIVWYFTRDARGQYGDDAGLQRRLSDQLEFIACTMYEFNRMIGDYLREDLGCQQLVNAGNWKTCDPVVVDPAERWAYTANQVLGKNHYYSPGHMGVNRGWQILDFHYFREVSAITDPTALPLNVKQAVGHPFIIPESLWVPPLGYQSEGPLMIAAQQCLTGVDCFYWFATGVPEWQPVGNKWTFATPMQMGQFPAAALLWRRGYVAEADRPAVYEERGLQNIWDRKSPIIAGSGSWDPNRDAGDLPPDSSVKGGVDPKAFLVGPVHVRYEGSPANNRIADLDRYIDQERGTIRSLTGQITTDYRRGIYTVNAPKAQAAAGFLKVAGEIELDDVTIRCRNDYATIVVVPLDDRPIAESGRLLVQVGTRCRPTGWKARPATFHMNDQEVQGKRILQVGANPWQVVNTRAVLTVRNRTVSKATLLDINGVPVRDVGADRSGGRMRVELPPETMYLMLR